MLVADGVEMLDLPVDMMGNPSHIFPTLLWDADQAILFDAGLPGQVPGLLRAIAEVGIPFDRLTTVIVTHHDIDHIGGLAGLRKELPPSARFLAYEEEIPYIDGQKRPLKLAQMEANLAALPPERQKFYETFKAAFLNSQVHIDQPLVDGEKLPFCGGITVIHTPGHTLGHICVYLQDSKVLVAGDAMRVENGDLILTPASSNHDTEMAARSLQKLTRYDLEAVICYHGGLFSDHPNQRIAALAGR